MPIRRFLFLIVLVLLISCEEPIVRKVTVVWPTEGTTLRIIDIHFRPVFTDDPTGFSVTFNGVEGNIQRVYKDHLAVQVPENATTGSIIVSRLGEEMDAGIYTVLPAVETQYFIRFKLNGVLTELESNSPPEPEGCLGGGDYQCHCHVYILPEDSQEYRALINFCLEDFSTPEAVELLEGKSMPFRTSDRLPAARFDNDINAQTEYTTTFAPNASEYNMNITKVSYNRTLEGGYDAFDVTGNFEVEVVDRHGSGSATVTEGSFVIPITTFHNSQRY